MTSRDFLVKVAAHALALALVMALRSTIRPMADSIDIKATPQKKVQVKLLGVDYLVKVPKKAAALQLMMRVKNAGDDPQMSSDAIDDLIIRMFGKEHLADVRRRLYEDDEDDLDIDHLMELMKALIEYATAGNPTT